MSDLMFKRNMKHNLEAEIAKKHEWRKAAESSITRAETAE